MRWASASVGVVGALLGVFVGLVQHGGLIGPVLPHGVLLAEITFAASGVVLIAALTSLIRPVFGMVGYVVALIGGVIGGGALWQLPGAFIFVSLVMLFIRRKGLQDA